MTILIGLSFAFIWVEVWGLGSVKPFNCLKCMCGWFTMFAAWYLHEANWLFYLPVGVLIGSLFTAIKGRWL